MDLSDKILNALKKSGTYLSGQELSEAFGVSRTAVWKAVNKLKKEGCQIEAVTNRGYRLISADDADRLNERTLRESFREAGRFGRPVIYRKEPGSTNTDIMELSDAGSPEGTLVIAEKQTKGKGRRGRTWISPPEGNLYMSLLLRPDFPTASAPMLTLLAAMAVRDGMAAVTGEEELFRIKWPNDIVAVCRDGKVRKVCGILTEMRLEEREIRDVVVGIGINVGQKEFAPEIAETAASLLLVLGRPVPRAELAAASMRRFEQLYDVFRESGSFVPLRPEYEEALINRGRKVRVLDPAGVYEGTAEGIDDTGALLVRTEDGKMTAVSAGEVSVRGVEGYV